MKRVSFFTLGCRTNQSETERMASAFEKEGWQQVLFGVPAEVCVVHTCCVTARSDMKVRQTIRKISRENPHAKIVVAGCSVHLYRDFFNKMPNVILTLNNSEKGQIAQKLKSVYSAHPLIPSLPEERGKTAGIQTSKKGGVSCGNHNSFSEINSEDLIRADKRTRAQIKIQEGCDRFCAYCIVPTVRGEPRSIPFDSLMNQFEGLLNSGYREIVLTGTHVGLYDCQGKTIENLLLAMADKSGDFRIHLSSIEPSEVTEKLIDLITHHPKICKHLHISFQSFSDPILSAMQRPYNFRFIENLVKKISDANSNINIGADIIVAFPGETDLLFEETLVRAQELPLHYGHVFRFSKRPGTLAASMKNQIKRQTAEKRSLALRGMLEKKNGVFIEAQKGKRYRVLIEDPVLKQGFTQNYLRVTVESEEPLLHNEFYPVKIIGQKQKEIIARLCRE